MSSPSRVPLALGLSVALLLTACSGGGDGDEPRASSSPTAEASDYLQVPEGTDLTPMGSELSFGDRATVAFEPRQDAVGVVDLTVTKVQQGRIGDLAAFKLDKRASRSTPYYVHARVKNTGSTNLSGASLPLYVADGNNRLITASRFSSAFRTCPSTPLPKGFTKGRTYDGCWLYLVGPDGDVESLSFYLSQDGFAPITWTGEVQKPKAAKKATKKSDKKKR